MIITKDGNIGISSSNPQSKLDINGDLYVNGSILFTGSFTGSSNTSFGNINLQNGQITDSSGSITFDNNNLHTDGVLVSGNLNVTGTGIFTSNITASAGSLLGNIGISK